MADAETENTPTPTEPMPAPDAEAPAPGTNVPSPRADAPADPSLAKRILAGRRLPVSLGQAALLVLNVVLIALVLVLVLRPSPRAAKGTEPPPAPAPPPVSKESAARDTAALEADAATTPAAADDDSLSWQTAEAAFRDGQHEAALAAYDRLAEACKGHPQEELLLDFFTLRSGQCQRALERTKAAHRSLTAAAESPSPLVRGLAHLESARLHLAEGQCLMARLHGYRALGALAAVEDTRPAWTLCDFLIAEALSRKALAFYNRDGYLPAGPAVEVDPFARCETDDGLVARLEAGADRFREAALGPKVAVTEDGAMRRRWTVTSAGAPLEEVLSRMTGVAALNIAWPDKLPAARRRGVVVCQVEQTAPRVAEVACGAAGLVARMTGADILIRDPLLATSTDEQRDLVERETVSAWRRFFLRADDPDRLAFGHFALGMVSEQRDDRGGAIAEYQLLAQRFPKSPLAPHARLRGAVARIDLKDYAGARDQLLDLLNRHPGFPEIDRVYLSLGEATMRAGLNAEALKTFKKLFYLELSQDSRVRACHGAGLCAFAAGDHEQAADWLTRYLNLAAGAPARERAEAAFTLARSHAARGKIDLASAALKQTLDYEPSDRVRTDALLELARLLHEGGRFGEAYAVLQQLDHKTTPPEKLDERVLVEARVLESVHLEAKALRLLEQAMVSATSAETAARMAIELARCAAATGDPDRARDILTRVLTEVDPGPLAHEASCLLAEVALADGHPDQAVSVCLRTLQRPASDTIKARMQQILGKAYLARREYGQAALTLSGLTDEKEAPTP